MNRHDVSGKDEPVMPRSRSVDSEPGKPRPRNTRSDAGRKKLSLRDWRGIHFVAEQTFVTVEQIGQWLAPEYEPAVDLPSLEPSQHGGNRHLAWPRDRKRPCDDAVGETMGTRSWPGRCLAAAQ